MTSADSRYSHSSPLYSASTWTASQRFNDNVLLTFGDPDGTDADFYYNGTNMVLDVNSGDLNVVIAGGDMAFQQASTISTTAGNLTLSAADGADVILGDNVTLFVVDGGAGTVGFGATAPAATRTQAWTRFPAIALTGNGTNTFSRFEFSWDGVATVSSGDLATLANVKIVRAGGAVSGVNLDVEASLWLSDPPSGDATLKYALWVDAGISRFDGDIKLDGDLDFTGPQSITTSSGNLTLSAATGADVKIGDNATLIWADGGLFGGVGGVGYGRQPGSNTYAQWEHPTLTLATNGSFYAAQFGAGSTIVPASSTAQKIMNVYVAEPNIDVSAAGASVVDAVSLYIVAAPTEGTSNNYALWVEAGASRFNGAISLGTDHGDDGQQLTSGGDNAACDWTAASSLRADKDVIGLADPDEALQAILSSKAYNFHYKKKKGTGETQTNYVGIMADEAPWAMHYNGKIVNPVNTLGYTVLAFQAMGRQVEELQERLAAIGG